MRLPLLGVALLIPVLGFAAVPPGFEDSALLAKVMKGEIVTETITDTKIETHTRQKAFYPNTEVEKYLKLVVNYSHYPQLFKEVKAGRLKQSNVSGMKEINDYELDISTKIGFLPFEVTAPAQHQITRSEDPMASPQIHNQIMGFEDTIETGTQDTLAYPYQGGLLISDTVHMKIKKANTQSNLAKKKLLEFFQSYTVIMRDALNEGYY